MRASMFVHDDQLEFLVGVMIERFRRNMSDACTVSDFFLEFFYPLFQARISDGGIVLRGAVDESSQDPKGKLCI